MRYLLFLLSFLPAVVWGQIAQDSVSCTFFQNVLHSGDVMGAWQATADNVVVENNHQGQWSQADQVLISVGGNSYRWNKFYLDGFRINSRFHTGSTYYVPNMEHCNMAMNIANSTIDFESAQTEDYLQLSGNFGNLGGVNPSTVGIVHWFHGTGIESAYNNISESARQHVRAAGTLDVSKKVSGYRQHLLFAMGNRQLPNYNQNGLIADEPLYGASYYKIQLDGELPTRTYGFFNHLNYLFHVSAKEDGLSEFYFNRDQQPRLSDFSLSLYGRAGRVLTTGLTWSQQTTHHDTPDFALNVVDQDGESLEPWVADGSHHELSWALKYKKELLPGLTLNVDGYNSFVTFSPTLKSWANEVYVQQTEELEPMPLYRYEWQSERFSGGLLENQVSLNVSKTLRDNIRFTANAGVTLDGMILPQKTKITPNGELGFAFEFRPWKWLQFDVQLQHSRVSYDVETLRYMSDSYMNAKVYYAGTQTLFTTTGGGCHQYAKNLWQPAFLSLYIPIKLHFGRHELAFIQTYKKFYHTWMTQYADGIDANGSFEDGIYYLTPQERQYEVGYLPTEMMGTGFLNNTPYFLSQQSRYTYHGRRVYFSISWQSMQGVGVSALGNGPTSNNVGVLSETTANPNTYVVLKNREGEYPAVGRYNQDKGFILRSYFSYNINKYLQLGCAGNWTDGQPFVYFRTYTKSDTDGNQVAIVTGCSRGTNTTDGNFGCRESAIFNFDLHARMNWEVHHRPMSLYVQCYNIWDFGNVLNEFCFPQGIREARGPNMCLTIPRGLIVTYSVRI